MITYHPDSRRQVKWSVSGWTGEMTKLTWEHLRKSKVPVELHRKMIAFEKRRKAIDKAREKEGKILSGIRKLSIDACEKADLAVAEAGRILVDEYQRPAELRAWSA